MINTTLVWVLLFLTLTTTTTTTAADDNPVFYHGEEEEGRRQQQQQQEQLPKQLPKQQRQRHRQAGHRGRPQAAASAATARAVEIAPDGTTIFEAKLSSTKNLLYRHRLLKGRVSRNRNIPNGKGKGKSSSLDDGDDGKGGKGKGTSPSQMSSDDENDGKGGKGKGTSPSKMSSDDESDGKGGKGKGTSPSKMSSDDESDGKGGKGKGTSSSKSSQDDMTETTRAPSTEILLFCIDFDCGQDYVLRSDPELRPGDDRATCCIREGVCSGFPPGSSCALGDIDETLIPNPSFEDFTECPTSFSELSRAVTWVQATGGTSDYFIGAPTCDDTWFRNGVGGIGELPQQAPDGDAFVGSIKQGTSYYEYIGACLLSPLVAGNVYTFTLDIAAATDAFSYGGDTNGETELLCVPSCDEFQISGADYKGDNYEIVATATPESDLIGGGDWQSITFEATPSQDCPAIMFGPGIGQSIQAGQLGSYVIYDFLNLQEGAAGVCNDDGECVEAMSAEADTTNTSTTTTKISSDPTTTPTTATSTTIPSDTTTTAQAPPSVKPKELYAFPGPSPSGDQSFSKKSRSRKDADPSQKRRAPRMF